MPLIVFSHQAGQVTTFADPAFPGQLSLKLTNWGTARRMKAIITRANLSASCNFQLMHALGGDAYLYVFGDRVGQSTLSGLAFETFCEEDQSNIGIEQVRKYYNENRLSAREMPLKITIGGGMSIKAYLAAFNADVEDAANRIWRFSLSFLEPPEPLPKKKKVNEDEADGVLPDDGAGVDDERPAQAGPVYSLDERRELSTDTDAGGYDPGLSVDPMAAGSGYSAYNSGPKLPSISGFNVVG